MLAVLFAKNYVLFYDNRELNTYEFILKYIELFWRVIQKHVLKPFCWYYRLFQYAALLLLSLVGQISVTVMYSVFHSNIQEDINTLLEIEDTDDSISNSTTVPQSVSWLLKWKKASIFKDDISLFWIFINT